MVKTAEELVQGVVHLISLPEIYLRANQVLDDPEHTAGQLGDVISHDPALTARILRIVNSVYYALAVKVDLVSRAISVVGENDLRNLILATSAVKTFARIPNQLLEVKLFWRHSVYTGIISRLLSRHCHLLHGERLFIVGMLHDIGKLLLYYKEPELSQKVLLEAAENNGVLYLAEKKIIGFSHADVGGALIDSWKLDDILKDAVRFHHTPLKAKKYPVETAIVHIADSIVNAISPGVTVDEHMLDEIPSFEPETLAVTGLDLTLLPDIIDKAGSQVVEVVGIIYPESERAR